LFGRQRSSLGSGRGGLGRSSLGDENLEVFGSANLKLILVLGESHLDAFGCDFNNLGGIELAIGCVLGHAERSDGPLGGCAGSTSGLLGSLLNSSGHRGFSLAHCMTTLLCPVLLTTTGSFPQSAVFRDSISLSCAVYTLAALL
jgi:hypothetical protein